MSRKYTAAIVGCGGIGNSHMDGYNLTEGIEVIAVADPYEPARRQYMDNYNIPAGYATVEEMVAKAQPDIVSVCAWHLLHAPLTVAAAQPGVKGIICEKPMTVSMSDANRMIEACDASGTKLVISHQRRFTAGWEKARELMQQQVIGQPLWVSCNVREGLLNWGTHAIDGARFVLGDPQVVWVMGAVERRTNRHERDTPIEDSCMGLVHLEDNLQLFIQSDLYKEPARSGGFLIRGTEGMLDVNEANVKLFNSTSNGWQDVPLGVDASKIRAIGGETNAAQVRELIAWIEGAPEHRGSGYKARVTVEIMLALYESARRHHVIHLPLKEGEYPLQLMIDEGQLPLEQPERYDIRGFLKRDRVDEDAYRRLRNEGMRHHQAMRTLQGESS